MTTETLTPTVPSEIIWHCASDTRWVALTGTALLGTIDQVGAFIATDSFGDVLGAFTNLGEAKRSIEDPEPKPPEINRRAHAVQVRRDARLKRAALLALLLAIVPSALIAIVLLTSARP